MSILAVIDDEREANALVRWSFQFARAKQCPLILVRTQYAEEENEITDLLEEAAAGDKLNEKIFSTLADEIKQAADISGTPHYDYHSEEEISTEMLELPETTVKFLKGRSLAGGILKMISQNKPQLLIVGRHQSLKGKKHFTDKIFQRAHCSTLIIRLGEAEFKRCSSLLIPCSSGPHCAEALKDAAALSHAQGSTVSPMIVEPNTSEIMEEVGEHVLQKIMKRCGLKEDACIKPRVVVSNDIEDAISNVAAEGFDLVILGASELGNLRKKLFGTLPEKIMKKSSSLSIGIYRRRQSNLRVFMDKLEYWFNLTVPQLGRRERVDLYENLFMNSTWNFDFVALTCLSTAIAALGLISDSAAVVIGAMLVAPLMVPILAAGLALVQGNVPLILNSAKSITLGFLSALGIGLICGLLTPMDGATSEILSRGSPRLADMFIAFLSGVAAAHCMSRPKLSAALPGVAIAAALVPPIASTGIALSLGMADTAMGAAILFLTNVICIILGSAITFFAAGIRNKNMKESQTWVRQCIIGLILCLSLLLIPLSSALITKITKSFTKVTVEEVKLKNKKAILTAFKPVFEKYKIVGIRNEKDSNFDSVKGIWTMDVDATETPDRQITQELETLVKEQFNYDINIRLRITLIID